MLAELLGRGSATMINQVRSSTRAAQFVHQLADLLVEVRDTIVVSIGRQTLICCGERRGNRAASPTSSRSVQTVGRRRNRTRNDVVFLWEVGKGA